MSEKMNSPVLDQMKLLVTLAQIDGDIGERESHYIINIGRANGFYPDQIRPLFDQTHELIIPENLRSDEKFNYIFTLVQLMKIDERMYKEEMQFCSEVAAKLGYSQQVMFDLLLHVKASSMDQDEIDNIKKLTEKYLN